MTIFTEKEDLKSVINKVKTCSEIDINTYMEIMT